MTEGAWYVRIFSLITAGVGALGSAAGIPQPIVDGTSQVLGTLTGLFKTGRSNAEILVLLQKMGEDPPKKIDRDKLREEVKKQLDEEAAEAKTPKKVPKRVPKDSD